MAVLGIQIVITMIMASLMSKIGPFCSLARWLLTSSGLIRYQHPTDEELKILAKIPLKEPKKTSAKSGRVPKKFLMAANQTDQLETFNVPRNLDIQLDVAPVLAVDVVQLRFYAEYQWLVDFAAHALGVYVLTEVYLYCFPARAMQEVNLSMVWCFLVAGFAYKILISLNRLYFQMEEGGERSLVIVMGFIYLLFAMMVLIVHEDTLETGLDEAYASFNQSAAAFLADNAGLDSSGPASKLVLKFFIALWCGSIGALFTFPGLRLAKMQWDVLKHTEGSGPKSVLIHTSFVAPLLLTTLWIKPLSRDYLTDRVFQGMDGPLFTENQFESFRLIMILVVVLLRLAVMPTYLQSYLNIAFYKMEELKQEAGKINNLEMQRRVARVFYYLCVVTLQYIAPMVLIFFSSLMYKTMGGGSWTGMWSDLDDISSSMPSNSPETPVYSHTSQLGDGQFSLAWQSLKQVFTPDVFRGLLGFSTWWCCLSWFLSSAIGILYQTYFDS